MGSDLDTLLGKLAATPQVRRPVERMQGTRRFEIKRRLGGGAFGDVYEARDREHGTTVALKALKSSDPDQLYRFKREFRVVADLSHPNLVRLYELFSEDDSWYLTMELVDGLRFHRHLKRSPQTRHACFAQLALGLHSMHDAGCVHRDVKPSNALVERTGRVVLLDFGLSMPQKGALHSVVAGTPPYMAPELAMGGEPSEASDWYAFGVMLYESLAGAPLYEGSRTEIFARKLAGPPPLDALPADADPELAELACALLAPGSADRPSGADILRVLDASARSRGPSRRLSAAATVVGRGRELRVLRQALEESRDCPTVVRLHAPPGMGKTSLVRAFSAGAEGAALFEGRCHESEAVPFKGLDGAIDALCDDLLRRSDAEVASLLPPGASALSQMFPVLKRVPAFTRQRRHDVVLSPHQLRRAGSSALRELLAQLAMLQRVVLFIDDLQWANDDGARLLAELLEPPAPHLLLIAAYRAGSEEHSVALRHLLDRLGELPSILNIDLPLGPLDAGGIADVLTARGETRVGADQALQETGGHPFLLDRYLRGGNWASGASIDLGDLLSQQLRELSPAARRVLEVVAIAATPLSQQAVFDATGEPWDTGVIDLLRRENLVQSLAGDADAPIEPYHDRVREATVAQMTDDHRRQLHGCLAEYLATYGRAEPEALAHHYSAAGRRQQALAWTRRAAREATRILAFARAAELYRDAVELAPSIERLPLLGELAEALVQAGRRVDAGNTCIEAAELAARLGISDTRSELRARAGEHFLLGGLVERGTALIRDVLTDVGITLPATDAEAVAGSFNLVGALGARGLRFRRRRADDVPPALLRRVDLELVIARAIAFTDVRSPWIATLALTDALEAGEVTRIQRALSYFSFTNAARAPDHPMVIEAIDRANRMARDDGDDVGAAWGAMIQGLWHMSRDEHHPALDCIRESERRFLAAGPAFARETAMARVIAITICGGYGVDITWARDVADFCITEADERGDAFAANWSSLMSCWVALATGQVDVARGRLARARSGWPRVPDSLFAVNSLINEIAIELYVSPDQSWPMIQTHEPSFHALFSSLMPVARSSFYRLRCNSACATFNAGRAGRDDTLARVARCDEAIDSLSYSRSMAHAVKAQLERLRGDRRGYENQMAKACDLWADAGQRGPELTARLRLAQLRGDHLAEDDAAGGLRAIGVVDPDRYSMLFAGPKPV